MRVLICTGRDCREAKGFSKVLELACSTSDPSEVACQDICRGPVVGVERDGELRWYASVRGPRRAALRTFLCTGTAGAQLQAVEVRRRRGRIERPRRRRTLPGG